MEEQIRHVSGLKLRLPPHATPADLVLETLPEQNPPKPPQDPDPEVENEFFDTRQVRGWWAVAVGSLVRQRGQHVQW
jgi:hypothetical protein